MEMTFNLAPAPPTPSARKENSLLISYARLFRDVCVCEVSYMFSLTAFDAPQGP